MERIKNGTNQQMLEQFKKFCISFHFFYKIFQNFVFQLDITSQNYQCPERNKLLFNTRVTKCALNMNWMSTAEVWDDFQHKPEVRLKFWSYSETKQSFILNTNVEMPHNKGINDLKFSSTHSVNNLLCASAGKDRTLKLWAQEDTKNIYRKKLTIFSHNNIKYRKIFRSGQSLDVHLCAELQRSSNKFRLIFFRLFNYGSWLRKSPLCV